MYDFCEVHTDRVKHFYDYNTKLLCCRACVEDRQTRGEEVHVTDLYEVDPSAVKNLFSGMNAQQQQVQEKPQVQEYYEDQVAAGVEKVNTSF